MKVISRIKIGEERVFMGKGMKELLIAIDKEKSIKQATISTGISYPKALKMLKTFEEETGFAAVISEKGGNTYGGSRLTPKGRNVLDCFIEIEDELNKYANKLVEEKFKY